MRMLVLLLLLAGCGSTPYFEVGVGAKVNADWYLEPEHGGGRNPTAHFALGLAWENGTACEANHWSHWLDGGPFNSKPETYKDEIICTKRWTL